MKKQLSLIIFFICISASSFASDAPSTEKKPEKDPYIELMKSDRYGNVNWEKLVKENPTAITPTNVNTPNGYHQRTALHYRAELAPKFKPTIHDLVEMKGDVNARDISDNTPLFKAANQNNVHVMQDLILHDADPFAKNAQGKSIIGWVEGCARSNRIDDGMTYLRYIQECMKVKKDIPKDKYVQFMACFSERIDPYTWRWYFSQDPKVLTGENINATDNAGQTALHLRMSAPIEVKPHIKSLLALKANIDAQDNNGETPLHKAVQSEKLYFGIIQALVEARADTSIKNKKKESVVDLLSKDTPEQNVMRFYLQSKAPKTVQPVLKKQTSKSTKKEEHKK